MQIAEFWLQRQPQAFTVFRSDEATVEGFVAILTLPDVTPAEAAADPALALAWRFSQR